jgi:hypothetical protein
MEQLSLVIPAGARRIETPAARLTDPESSHDAEAHINATGSRAEQQAQTVAAIRQFPGLTMRELSAATGIDRYVLGRRVSECETSGAVRRGVKRDCAVSKRKAEPWWPA